MGRVGTGRVGFARVVLGKSVLGRVGKLLVVSCWAVLGRLVLGICCIGLSICIYMSIYVYMSPSFFQYIKIDRKLREADRKLSKIIKVPQAMNKNNTILYNTNIVHRALMEELQGIMGCPP